MKIMAKRRNGNGENNGVSASINGISGIENGEIMAKIIEIIIINNGVNEISMANEIENVGEMAKWLAKWRKWHQRR
jgi:hypothetical protein